ncbi:hypothetical protein BcepSauron_378 [Burkholderia phage BcepSauron]|uniref:Uncharacterized protein n=1 Tax=Burkholderia phage BcepSauron TaxID=2530033 RepID=A0A482MM75_9CAUD|nr:hypothetical protein H1O17_gp378 [Burkholderia phage BcepSauron]QBQ74758.1 hypothetical protein BcepSauron_378 [Burkholderia phage BcepSauron]
MKRARGEVYGSSYSGCEGWNSWLVDVVIVEAADDEELQMLKTEIENVERARGDRYVRRNVVWGVA